jgi:hypothetical protein
LVGTFSTARPTEEEEQYLPQIDKDYRTMLAEHMKGEGIANEEEVDYFKFPLLTQFRKQRLDEIRQGKKRGVA